MSEKVSPEVVTQVLCGATLGVIAAGRLFIRGQAINPSLYVKSLTKPRHVALSQVLFLAGLIAAGLLLSSNESSALEDIPEKFSPWKSAAAGLLVGWGSSLAGGCEVGHGCCGVASLSPRSLVFLIGAVAAGIGSATFFDSSSQLEPLKSHPTQYGPQTNGQALVLFAFAVFVMGLSGFFGQHDEAEIRRGISQAPKNFALYGGDVGEGVLYAYAAALGGIAKPSLVAASLHVGGPNHRATLWYVMAGAILLALPAFLVVYRIVGLKESISGTKHAKISDRIDGKVVLGALLFGLGWGLTGMTPVTALIALPTTSPAVLVFLVSLMGAYQAF